MSDLDLDALDAAALRDGTIPAQQAHALIAELRLLRQQVKALDLRERAEAPAQPDEVGWASIG